jgi:hypothetical protein
MLEGWSRRMPLKGPVRAVKLKPGRNEVETH